MVGLEDTAAPQAPHRIRRGAHGDTERRGVLHRESGAPGAAKAPDPTKRRVTIPANGARTSAYEAVPRAPPPWHARWTRPRRRARAPSRPDRAATWWRRLSRRAAMRPACRCASACMAVASANPASTGCRFARDRARRAGPATAGRDAVSSCTRTAVTDPMSLVLRWRAAAVPRCRRLGDVGNHRIDSRQLAPR